jgi:formate dehydrogenase (coenzyme F420) alpha subunit
MAHRLTTCTFCGVGCGLYLETSGNRVIGVSPSISHPSNEGRICIRGWNVHEVISSPDRLKKPLLRKNGKLQEATWDEALGFIVSRLQEIRGRHGPDAIAFLNSPRCSNEEAYLLQKLARAVIKTNNVDHGAGVYSNYSISVLLDMLGVPASTNSYHELAKSEVIIVAGVDMARKLPTLGGTVIRAKLKGSKLIVIDERHHRVAESADLLLQHKPGTDSLLFGAMAKVVVDHGLMDLSFIKGRCRDYEAFLENVNTYDLLAAAKTCGVPAELIEAAALAYARAKSAAILYSTGIRVRDIESIMAKVNLALLCGQIGKEGAGVFSLTDHNNLQGVGDMGMLPDRLPGYRSVSDDVARAEVELLWNTDLSAKPGLSASSVLTDRGNARIRAAWLCRYDPVSTAFIGDAATSLEQCELVVMQHVYMTETANYAHVMLPTAVFGEELVTFTNAERRIQLATQVIDPPQGITSAWQQLTAVAKALGADWEYRSSSEIMDEIGAVVPFYSGANYDNLAREYGRQWPCTKDQPLGTPYLFSDDHHGRMFKFVPVENRPQAIVTNNDYPLMLIFGHTLYYWNQNVFIKHSETLKREYSVLLNDYPNGFAELNTEDAKRLGIRSGDTIRLHAAHGSTVTTARVTPEVRSGSVFVPYFVRQARNQICGERDIDSRLVPVRVEKEAQ